MSPSQLWGLWNPLPVLSASLHPAACKAWVGEEGERKGGQAEGEAYVSGWGKDLCLGMSPVAGGEAPSFGQPQNVPCRAWALPHPGSSTGRRTSFPVWKSAFPPDPDPQPPSVGRGSPPVLSLALWL